MLETDSQEYAVAPPLSLTELQEHLHCLAHESELHDFCEMRDRVQERIRDSHNPLLIMVVGEGKFGKSTLINALSGKPIAPVSIIPKTWKVDLYEAIAGEENASLSWRSIPDAPETIAIPEAQRVCSKQEEKAKEAKAQELSWKSDLYQVHWRVNALWPPEGVALVDTPGFSQLRADSSVANTFLYGSKGIAYEASDAFKYYYYRADVVLWCIRSDRLQDHETLEMLKASGKRDDIVGILTHMDKIPDERWQEVETKASEIYGEYISKFLFSALGPKARPDLIDGLRSYLESQYISEKEETKSGAIRAFLSSEFGHFAGDVNSVMGLYFDNFSTRLALVRDIAEEMNHIRPSAKRTMEDVAQRFYDKAVAKLPTLWDQADGSIERFEAYVQNHAAEPRLLCDELNRMVVSAANEAVNTTNVSLANTAWKGVRLNSEASPQAFSSQVLSQITSLSRTSVAGLRTTFTGGEGIGTGLTVGAVGAGIGALALGPIGLAAGAIGLLVGALTKRGRCLSKAKDALKSCYDENVRREFEALEKCLASTCSEAKEAVDASLAEHHGKDIAGVMSHAVLADNSCMELKFSPMAAPTLGPASFHRNGERFQSIYTADLCTVVPEIAATWDASCLEEWGKKISAMFSQQWHDAIHKLPSLSSREEAIEFYSGGLKDALASKMEGQHELLVEAPKLLEECSIRQDFRNTVPSFRQILNSCDRDQLGNLASFTGVNYESQLGAEYSKRVEHAFAHDRPYLGSKLITSFRPGCFVTIAIILGFIGLFTGTLPLAIIGGCGVAVLSIAYLLSKRNTKKQAMHFAEEVVGTFYDEAVSSLETAIRDKFNAKLGAK